MPERPLTIATYAAGASLAAITLVYVFGPTFFLDDEAANSSRSSRKKGVVGLFNPANDCFINSVLQALAGLPDLRTFLIREVHRRALDGPELYADHTAAAEEHSRRTQGSKKPLAEWQIVGLQQGLVTAGLKEVLDALNERPIYKKTVSAQPFIRCVEQAFRTRISRTQQDAQEFLQVIAERLAEEYYAGKNVRRKVRQRVDSSTPINPLTPAEDGDDDEADKNNGRARDSKMIAWSTTDAGQKAEVEQRDHDVDNEDVFPLGGKLESEVECLHCHFKPKPSISSFLTLTLSVPHLQTSTTLNECFDGMFKVEQIDDFKCDRCRLDHAISINAKQLTKTSLPEADRASLERAQVKLQHAIDTHPETPPQDVKLPELATAPRRRITRHTRISTFPKILSIHLSRSVWDPSASSSKNMAKVSFPESLPLGSLLHRKHYRLLGVVTHKGGHNSGHYESFRRQVSQQPFSTPTNMGTQGIYSIANSPVPSTVNSPRLSAFGGQSGKQNSVKDVRDSSVSSSDSPFVSSPVSVAPSISSASALLSSMPTPTTAEVRRSPHHPAASIPFEAIPTPGLPTPPQSALSPPPSGDERESPSSKKKASFSTLRTSVLPSKKRATSDRWWRISDEKVKECKTSDVLGMQREVYLLFYEMVGGGAELTSKQ